MVDYPKGGKEINKAVCVERRTVRNGEDTALKYTLVDKNNKNIGIEAVGRYICCCDIVHCSDRDYAEENESTALKAQKKGSLQHSTHCRRAQ